MTHAPRQTVVSIIFGNELFGKERGTLEALKALKSSGVEVVVCVSGRVQKEVALVKRRVHWASPPLFSGDNFTSGGFIEIHGSSFAKLDDFSQTRELFCVFASEIQTKCHFLNGTLGPFLFCKMALSIVPTPVIYRIGDAPPTDSKFQMMLWRQLIKRSTRIACVSHFIAKQVKAYVEPRNHQQISVIWNRVVSRTPLNTKKRVVLNDDDKPDLTLVYVGQMDRIEGVDAIVQAAVNLDNPKLCIQLLGGNSHSAEFEAELQRHVQESKSRTRVHFQGYRRSQYFCQWPIGTLPHLFARRLSEMLCWRPSKIQHSSVMTRMVGLPEHGGRY